MQAFFYSDLNDFNDLKNAYILNPMIEYLSINSLRYKVVIL